MKVWLKFLLAVSLVSSNLSRIIETPQEVKEHIDRIVNTPPTPTTTTFKNTKRPQDKLVEYELYIQLLKKKSSSPHPGKLLLQFNSVKRNSTYQIDSPTLNKVRQGSRLRNIQLPIKFRNLKSVKAKFIGDDAQASLNLGKIMLKPFLTASSSNTAFNGRCAIFSAKNLLTNKGSTKVLESCRI
ncbi:hypothetical protein HDE_04347 [Halotydeus destructor]|nr:hypothetical protein HDE_04347 [Halotydeus destructor]